MEKNIINKNYIYIPKTTKTKNKMKGTHKKTIKTK